MSPRERWAPWLLVGGIAALALALRLRDPLASIVLANEDPYLMLFRAQRLGLKGAWPEDYTKGFPALLVAMQQWGLPMYDVARLAPAVWGAAGAAGMFFLAQRLGGTAAGAGAGFLFAAMPELVQRGDFLAPTAQDLALVPLLAWAALDLAEGRLRALPLAGVVALWLAFAHPWGLLYLALALAPLAGRFLLSPATPRWERLAAAGCVALGLLVMLTALQGPDTGRSPLQSVAARGLAWLAAPTLAYTAPRWVDPVAMLGVPALVLGAVGALRGPRELRLLGLGWAAMLAPVAALPLTDVVYAPQRTVAFLAPGLALLGGAACAWLWTARVAFWVHRSAPARPVRVAAVAMAALLLASATAAPAATAKTWWRIYQPEEQELYWKVAAVEDAIIVTGSWQAAVNLGAWGADARPLPGFFRNDSLRRAMAADAAEEGRPLLVVIDRHVRNKADPDHPSFAGYNYSFVHGHGQRIGGAGRVVVMELHIPVGPPAAVTTTPAAPRGRTAPPARGEPPPRRACSRAHSGQRAQGLSGGPRMPLMKVSGPRLADILWRHTAVA